MKNGFTLIELIVVMIIITILAVLIFPAISEHNKHEDQQGMQSGSGQQSDPLKNNFKAPEPTTKIECVDGYKFVAGKQMLDASGHGIYCN